MSSIKKLAGQTLWYGVPTILSRFLNYLLSLLLVGIFKPDAFGVITNIYAAIPFLNIVFTYGLETSYFRFVQIKDKNTVYDTLMFSIIGTTILFTLPLLYASQSIANFMEIPKHPEYIRWMAWIVFFDTLSTIPFAKLRQEGRPRKFAFIRVMTIAVNILFTVFFYLICPKYQNSLFFFWYDPHMGVGYVLIANIIASVLGLLFLFKEISAFKPIFSFSLWKEIMHYSLPLLVVGFGGMINDMLSRFVYLKVSPDPPAQKEFDLGVFGANYKLAVLITLFIQVFRMAAEPFFFNQSKEENAQKVYSRVMKFFVIACCFMFLLITMFLNVWKSLITWKHKEYGEGIHIVPTLAMAGIFLGIYYNLSVWYKLTGRNMTGAYITIAGAIITILLNIWWIPPFGYTGSAWATFICYLFMMVTSYVLGQKYYPIPYNVKKLVAYLLLVILLYLVHRSMLLISTNFWYGIFTGLLLTGVFTYFIFRVERKEFKKLPWLGKYVM